MNELQDKLNELTCMLAECEPCSPKAYEIEEHIYHVECLIQQLRDEAEFKAHGTVGWLERLGC